MQLLKILRSRILLWGYGFGQSEWKGKQNYILVAMMCACGFNFSELKIILYVMCVIDSFVFAEVCMELTAK